MRKPTTAPITQNYSSKHNGIDFSGRFDKNVYAPEAGTLSFEYQPTLGGNVLKLKGKTGEHRLAHFSTMNKKSGQVFETQVLGVMGKTGKATAVHLHWGILRNGKYINPLSYVDTPPSQEQNTDMYTKEQYEKMEAIANDWHQRAEDRQKVIVRLENEVQDLKAQITTTPKLLTKGIYEVK